MIFFLPLRLRALYLAFALAMTTAVPAAAQDTGFDDEPAAEGADDQGTDDYEPVIEIVFPTAPDAHFSDDYHAPRGGGTRVHKATDMMAPKFAPLWAAADGVICMITGVDEPMPSWGYALAICGDDGIRYTYIHVNNDSPGTDDGEGGVDNAYAPGVRRGARVAAGDFIGWVGDSGNAESTAPHLHFEMVDENITDPYETNRLNPYPSLVAAIEAGRVRSSEVPAEYARDTTSGDDQATTEPQPASGAANHETRPATTDLGDRVSGPDRVATAIALSEASFGHTHNAVVAPSHTPHAALVAGPLATLLGAPVLTTSSDSVDGRVAAEIERLGVETSWLVGLDGAAAGNLDTALIGTARGSAADRYDLAAEVADRVWELVDARSPGTPRRAVLALGAHDDPNRTWPDSLVASWYGSLRQMPVLLTAGEELPTATRNALADVDEVVIVGGPAAISDDVEADVARISGASVTRLWGGSRYSTAMAVVDDVVDRGLADPDRVWITTGRNWPDATAAASAVRLHGGLLVLVDGDADGADGEVRDWIADRVARGTPVTAIGGPVAVSEAAADAVRGWIR